MSSFRYKREKNTMNSGHHCVETESCITNRNKPGLLRLDSTGEVTSARKISNCQSPLKKNDSLNKKDVNKIDKNCYKNFTMGSLIDSASAYFGSATSYFGNLCPCKTSKGLARSDSGSSSFDYLNSLKTIFSGASGSDNMEKQSVPTILPGLNGVNHTCNCATQSRVNPEMDKSMKWTSNIFGAIQCSLLSNCPAKQKMKTPNIERYVPPQRRYNHETTAKRSSTVNPKLTPYNAKLLEKSKRSQSERNVKDEPHHCRSPQVHRRKCEKTKPDIKAVCDENLSSESKNDNKETLNEELLLDTVAATQTSEISEVNRNDQTTETEKETDSLDWFEYECKSVKCIPISIEKLQLSSQKCANNDLATSQGSDSSFQQLHSWFSIENNNDVIPITGCEPVCNDSSQIKKGPSLHCDKTEYSVQNEIIQKQERIPETVCEDSNKSEELVTQPETGGESLPSDCESKPQEVKDNDTSVIDDHLISVLCVRSLGKKGRPSAKKRRRHKTQQNDSVEQMQDSNPALKPGSATHPNSSIAFILGYNSENSENDVHSFRVSCDMNSDSDWTESDCESDENFSSLEDEAMLANELGFQCNDPLNSMKFRLTCTMQPADNSPVPNSSAIDDINLSWKIQVSVEPDTYKKKTSSSKKVHFPDDKDLTTVHPIIAWSHAYQSARKGPWEQYARDRGRFLRRITDGEILLKPVLDSDHRDRIFSERFNVELE